MITAQLSELGADAERSVQCAKDAGVMGVSRINRNFTYVLYIFYIYFTYILHISHIYITYIFALTFTE